MKKADARQRGSLRAQRPRPHQGRLQGRPAAVRGGPRAPLLPTVESDLPGGARRLVQKAEGIRATIVNGVVTLENGESTGHLPAKYQGKAGVVREYLRDEPQRILDRHVA